MVKKLLVIDDDGSLILEKTLNAGELKIVMDKVFRENKDLAVDDYHECSVKEFLESKLNGFLNKMTRVDNSHLYETIITEVDKALLGIVLKETGGNQLKAAKILGINRNTLGKKIKDYKLI